MESSIFLTITIFWSVKGKSIFNAEFGLAIGDRHFHILSHSNHLVSRAISIVVEIPNASRSAKVILIFRLRPSFSISLRAGPPSASFSSLSSQDGKQLMIMLVCIFLQGWIRGHLLRFFIPILFKIAALICPTFNNLARYTPRHEKNGLSILEAK